MNFNRFFVKNYQFTLVIFIALLILGLNSLLNMPRSEDPPFGAPIFSVVAVFPGTSPEDMEKLIVEPIEEVLYQLEDIKRIKTRVADGLMVSQVEFNYGVDVDNKNTEVLREVDRLRPELPDGIVRLEIERAASSDVAILQTALVSESASFEELKAQAEELEKQIEKIKDIKWVEIQGIPDRLIQIELDLDRMASLDLGLDQVLGLIQANNVNIPGGDIDLGQRKYNIKTESEYSSLEEIADVVINTTSEGRITRLSDIANVYFSHEDQEHIVRYNGRRAIWVVSAMKDRRNIIQVRDQIEAILVTFENTLPDQIEMYQAFDQEKGVQNRLAGLGRDFLIAIFLVLLTLLPLGPRASFVVMISIPLSLSIGLFLLDLLGYTLNQLSIVGMVIALGLLVDDSIVVVENIERYMRGGISAKKAAVSATNHIMVAILGCTATLLFAFLPLANLPEGSGEFIRPLPMAVMLTVLASLFVSVTIIPFLSSILLRKGHREGPSEGNFFFRSFKKYVNDPYQRLLVWCMKNRWLTLLFAAIIFGSSLLLVPVIGFSLFPSSEKPILTIDIETEPGSNLHHTDLVTRDIERILATQPEIERMATNVGKGNPRIYYNVFQTQNTDHRAQIMVFMKTHTQVPEIVAFADHLRKELAYIPGAKIEVNRFQQGPPIAAPIEIRILGDNLDTLDALGERVESIFHSTDGTMYVNNELKYKTSELKIDIDKRKAGLYGLNSAEIAKTVRLAIAGLDISEFDVDQEDPLALRVSIANNTANMMENFDRISITSASGSLVPLKNVASLSISPAAPVINRFNKERYSLISAFVERDFNVSNLTDQIIERINTEVRMPSGYRFVAAGERESSQDSFGGIETIIILTVFGLLAILILEFKAFKSTLIVLSVIPMGVVGALSILYLNGETLSFVATVGIIALAGIEVKNSILMVDYTNALRAKGMDLYQAVMDGAETRFLPILLTTLTAIGGMIPLVLERSPLISPLALVLIGGLISSALLSRLVTPVLYYMIPPKIEVQELEDDELEVL